MKYKLLFLPLSFAVLTLISIFFTKDVQAQSMPCVQLIYGSSQYNANPNNLLTLTVTAINNGCSTSSGPLDIFVDYYNEFTVNDPGSFTDIGGGQLLATTPDIEIGGRRVWSWTGRVNGNCAAGGNANARSAAEALRSGTGTLVSSASDLIVTIYAGISVTMHNNDTVGHNFGVQLKNGAGGPAGGPSFIFVAAGGSGFSPVYDYDCSQGLVTVEWNVDTGPWRTDSASPQFFPSNNGCVISVDINFNPGPPPVIDVCPNIAGAQATIPPGMFKDGSGNCVPLTVDVCPNIAGNQASVPRGMIIDGSGNCVIPASPEMCDGIDNDLDGFIDEGCPMGVFIYANGQQSALTIPTAGTITISWSTNGAPSFCVASPEWGGGIVSGSGGSQPGVNVSGTTTFSITCQKPGSLDVSDSVTVDINPAPPPPPPPPAEVCNDGIDNNGDGRIDENCVKTSGQVSYRLSCSASGDTMLDIYYPPYDPLLHISHTILLKRSVGGSGGPWALVQQWDKSTSSQNTVPFVQVPLYYRIEALRQFTVAQGGTLFYDSVIFQVTLDCILRPDFEVTELTFFADPSRFIVKNTFFPGERIYARARIRNNGDTMPLILKLAYYPNQPVPAWWQTPFLQTDIFAPARNAEAIWDFETFAPLIVGPKTAQVLADPFQTIFLEAGRRRDDNYKFLNYVVQAGIVAPPTDLSITSAVMTDPFTGAVTTTFNPGQPARVTYTIRNSGSINVATAVAFWPLGYFAPYRAANCPTTSGLPYAPPFPVGRIFPPGDTNVTFDFNVLLATGSYTANGNVSFDCVPDEGPVAGAVPWGNNEAPPINYQVSTSAASPQNLEIVYVGGNRVPPNYGVNEQPTFTYSVTNRGASPVNNIQIGFWPKGSQPNCSSTPATPPPSNTSDSWTKTIATLAPGASQNISFTFNVGNSGGTAYAYVTYSCVPNDSNWGDNYSAQSYSVSTTGWFETIGGDVGSEGALTVSGRPYCPSLPTCTYTSRYLLAESSLSSTATTEKWKLNNYTGRQSSGNVYNSLAGRFKSKATGGICSVPALLPSPAAPASSVFNLCGSSVTLSGSPALPTGNNFVWFIDGDLTITDNFTIPANKTIIFIVAGDIIVSNNVTSLDGIYVAGAVFTDTIGASNDGPQLNISGAVYAGNVLLDRNCNATCNSLTQPVEKITFEPKYIEALNNILGSSAITWQEVAP